VVTRSVCLCFVIWSLNCLGCFHRENLVKPSPYIAMTFSFHVKLLKGTIYWFLAIYIKQWKNSEKYKKKSTKFENIQCRFIIIPKNITRAASFLLFIRAYWKKSLGRIILLFNHPLLSQIWLNETLSLYCHDIFHLCNEA
jgi:hypothetical protein